MRNEREDHTLQPTALLNEAYIRLVDQSCVDWRNRAHFFGIAARAMRQVLIEHARQKSTAKRGGQWTRIEVSDEAMLTSQPHLDLVDLDEALAKLAQKSERMAQVVELRVFGGLTGEEIATVLDVSRKTVVGDWRVAQMWMRAELAGEPQA